MRRYGQWAGRPNGSPEVPGKCVVEVYHKDGWISYQCHKKRLPDGLLCRHHLAIQNRGQHLSIPDDGNKPGVDGLVH